MAQHADHFERLKTAAGAWNALVKDAFPEIERSLKDAADAIARLAQSARQNPRLDLNRLKEMTSAYGVSKLGLAEDASEQLVSMRDVLGDFQIEAETLRAQALRALGSAQRLASALKPFRDLLAPATSGPAQATPAAPSSQREQELEATVERLRAALEDCRRELSDLRAAAPGPLPVNVQEELATLRVEVATLRETNERLRRPLPGTSDERFEVIASQAFDTEGQRKMLGQILVDAGVIKDEHLEIALHEQQSSWRRHLGAILVDLGFATEENIAHALAAQLALPFIDLRKEHISEEAVALVGRHLAIHHTCIPLRVSNEGLRLAIANPLDLVALDDLRLATGRNIQPVVATAGQIKQVIRERYPA